MSNRNEYILKDGTVLKIENNKRIWLDKDNKEITVKELNDEEFNIIDCNLCHMLLTENVYERFTPIYWRKEHGKYRSSLVSDGKYSIIDKNVYVSSLDWDLARQIMMTPLPENSWWCHIYDAMHDSPYFFRPKTYYDIYKSYADDMDYVYVCELGVPFYRKKEYGEYKSKTVMDKYYWIYINKELFPDCDDIKDDKYVELTDCGVFRKCIGNGQMR